MADDDDDLRHIRRLIHATAPTLLIQTKNGVYPYEVSKQLELPEKFSASTNSMVAHSVACIGGLLARHSQVASFPLLPDRDPIITKSLTECAGKAVERLLKSMRTDGDNAKVLNSVAFGKDDPFTIGWLLELLEEARHWASSSSVDELDRALNRVRSAARRRVIECLKDPDKPVLRANSENSGRFILHPLPLLRVVQIARLLEETTDDPPVEDLPEAFEWFLSHLHLQLSRRNIQHSGFDIAELVFCLEGMLAAGRSRVTQSILDSVVSALNEARQLNSALRATTPFKVTRVGAVHLFASVEVVASLLRSAVLLERHDQAGFFRALKPTLRHYLSWLQATMLRGETSLPERNAESDDPYPDDVPLTFAGWQSEHSHTDDNSVHIWITSQVILFLRGYETLLSADIAEAALQAAGVSLEQTIRTTMEVRDLRSAALRDDPLQLAEESPYRVVSRLNELFVEPRLDAWVNDAPYSCLLYGPPGTGKTTLARRIAADLGWPLLTITTSDFIIDGEAQVEARAKRIFSTLELQTGIVIFFDEIDRLLLGRDDESYNKQGDMLQFMTPSMLTKINDLRRAERCIFIIGTNYADRIDPAIKRAGRIDYKFLVLPPDQARRAIFLRAQLDRLPGERRPSDEEVDSAAAVGGGRTIAELQSAVRNYMRGSESLTDHVRAVSPALSLATYKRKLVDQREDIEEIVGTRGELLEEAYLVAYLLNQNNSGTSGREPEYDWLANLWGVVRKFEVVRDPRVTSRLDELFASGGQVDTR